jgi:hypothetical protein
MPVDRRLALESLKKYDEELYYLCSRLEEVKEYLSSDPELYERLQHYLYCLDTLDFLESLGKVAIINDYEKREVFVKKLQRL